MTTTTPTASSLFDLAGDAMALQRQIAELAEQLHSDDGAIDPDVSESLEALLLEESGSREALQRKADAYCWVISQLRGQAAYRKAESDRLRDLADADARRADALQERLLSALAAVDADATRWSLPAHEITSRKTEIVVVDPDADLPPELTREKRVIQPDKTAIKAAIKAGRVIPGAELVKGRSWSIR